MNAPLASVEQLLAAAAQELRKGEGDFEMSAVARAAGVSVGLAYHYFGSKAGLIAAVVEDYYEKLDREVIMAAIPIADWRERERLRTERMVAFHYEHPLAEIILGRLRREPAVIEIERSRHARHIEEGARNMRDGQKQGAVDADLDPATAAAFVLGGLRAAIARTLALRRSERPSAAVVSDQAWSLVFRVTAPLTTASASKRKRKP